MTTLNAGFGLGVALLGAGGAMAGPRTTAPELTLEAPAPITLDMSRTLAQDEPGASKAAGAAKASEASEVSGRRKAEWCQDDGGWWITIGAGVASDFDTDEDYNLHVAASTFLARDFEFAVELGGWYFDQAGPNTGGVNGSFIFRWHFWHDASYSYTVYGDAGIGLLGSFDDTPQDGTSVNFTPRLGMGATFRLDEAGDRLQVGLRYHHISNARVEGDSNNPSRDSVMAYVGIVFPF